MGYDRLLCIHIKEKIIKKASGVKKIIFIQLAYRRKPCNMMNNISIYTLWANNEDKY